MSKMRPTKNGYTLFDASSAMQKGIRRNQEREALFWAFELWEGGYHKYVWKRLLYILSEEVSIAEPTMPAQIKALHDLYIWAQKEYSSEGVGKLYMIHAVVLLSRAKKSRVCNNLFFLVGEDVGLSKGAKEIPDHAYDMHTRVGKSKGRGFVHFGEVASFVTPLGDVDMEGEYKAEVHELFEYMDKNGGARPSESESPELVLEGGHTVSRTSRRRPSKTE